MIFEIGQESRAFMQLASKALKGQLNPQEQQQLDRLFKNHPDMKGEFQQLQQEIKSNQLSELWERGLRVLMQVAQDGDKAFLASVKSADPATWKEFLRGAFVLKVMAESMKTPFPASFSNELTEAEEEQLFAAIKASQAEKRQAKERKRPK